MIVAHQFQWHAKSYVQCTLYIYIGVVHPICVQHGLVIMGSLGGNAKVQHGTLVVAWWNSSKIQTTIKWKTTKRHGLHLLYILKGLNTQGDKDGEVVDVPHTQSGGYWQRHV